MSLDVPTRQFQRWIEEAGELIAEYYEEKSDKRVFAGKSAGEVIALFDEPLPEKSSEIESVLSEVREKVLESITNSAGPKYFGYITGGGNQVAVLAEMIKASLNQNNLKWHSSPVSTEMERLVMRWVAAFIGYPETSAGVLLSGGSVANFNCLAVARKIKSPVDVAEEGVYGSPPQTVYVSAEGHSSFDKAVDMLGLGKKYLRKIPVDEEQRIIPDALDEAIGKDKENGLHPICGIGVAGTTNTGAVDDLNAVADICEKHNIWCHVDAAYGGPAAAVSGVSHLFDGIERADSVVINPHKWMFVPFEAGGVLVKDPEHLRATFSTIPDYLKSDKTGDARTDLMEYNLPLTKEFKALKVWMTLKAYGAQKIRETIREDIDKAAYLVEKIKVEHSLELMAPAPLSIVCFRYRSPGAERNEKELNKINDELIHHVEQDGRVFLTGTKIDGATAMRVCFINHRTERRHIDELVEVVLELGELVSA
ncbi:aminotransferase class I/II-fold pyridoxal phosphate-dependent enzyme [Balneolaceae bacterium YR4-1]|uniref:Aminotransferase class I/II-fold pyridoxal phosphate-dependent enzyme n=1 Tax=Halalkalibaculum roseum TaxID=2709311 RepID=A0A6M1SXJ5_9BACT|nr:aminotransferase class I/II-fold pyridoxal phosphate-dependent enzyme [Halalkalibaculum roseum]NGP77800.1 aminotransferase class I/II-fold pyridoxal phosphate-dependent enzyme [Halalkalibaculum roseum]